MACIDIPLSKMTGNSPHLAAAMGLAGKSWWMYGSARSSPYFRKVGPGLVLPSCIPDELNPITGLERLRL